MSCSYNFTEEDLKNIQDFMENGDIATLDRAAGRRPEAHAAGPPRRS